MDPTMARRHHAPEQIIKKLRDAEVMQAAGQTIAELAKQLKITEQTYYYWRKQFGGMETAEVKRLKDLAKENASPKRIVA